MPPHRAAWTVALIALNGCFVTSAVAAADPITSIAELRARLEAHLRAPRFDRALWSVKIASLQTGGVLFEHEPHRLMSPASNSKLYTTALALDLLGGDYRIATPILATAAPDSVGILHGDVIVSGRGDPSWTTGPGRDGFPGVFDPFVAVLEHAGVKRITGDLIADATYFRMPPNGAGWAADDLNDDYGAEISALTLANNYADVRITPGTTVGARASLVLLQPHTGLTLDNQITTIAKGAPRHLELLRLFGETTVFLFGQLPLGSEPVMQDVTVPRPAAWFAAGLKAALNRRGIVIEGGTRALRWPEPSAVRTNLPVLGEIISPPMKELLKAMMKPSQNLQADLIFAHLGEKFRASDAPAWRTSEQSAVALLRDCLRQHALPADEVRFEEGSGLSRNNLASANATLALLQFMHGHREAAAFVDTLPIAGIDGTLRRRMKATPAEGNLRAKTGTLRWANALSGYVTTGSGERLVFSLMLNRYVPSAGQGSRDELDTIALLLAAYNPSRDAPVPSP